MAEILLSLTIIGVVAAITLPSLTGNINERTWNTQRKALYARFSQAIALMPALNGYGTLAEDASGSVTEDNVAETFITSGLAKVLKINNICSPDNLADCGVASKINTTASAIPVPADWATLAPKMISATYTGLGSHSMINSKAAAFETANGETIVVYYNQSCRGDNFANNSYIVSPFVCANFIYDLNGSKGPNTVGKDIGFMTALYSSDTNLVAPAITGAATRGLNQRQAQEYCRNLDDARLPNREESIAMAVNLKLMPAFTIQSIMTSYIWPSSKLVGHMAWGSNFVFGMLGTANTTSCEVQCIKR